MASVKRTTQHNAQSKRKNSRELNAIRALAATAIVLGVITLVLVGVKLAEGDSAGQSAAALLEAYKIQASATPSASPDAGAVPPTEQTDPLESPAPTDENYEETSMSADTAAAADADEHRVAGDDIAVNEGGAYVQPDAPDEVSDLEATIEKIIGAAGDDGVIGVLEIPELEEELPIIGKWSYKLLKISVCRYKGPDPNEPGNLVVIGHNYKNGSHFGRLNTLKVGSELYLTDTASGTRVKYEVYQIKSIAADAFSALKPYEGECGLTLMTCKDNGTNRLLLRCKQV